MGLEVTFQNVEATVYTTVPPKAIVTVAKAFCFSFSG